MAIEIDKLSVPSASESQKARVAAQALAPLLESKRASTTLRIAPEGRESEAITVPRHAFDLFLQILAHMANGDAVTVMSLHAEITTQQAADLLNVSRPHLVRLLENGTIPFRKVGTHRRLLVNDLLAYKRRVDSEGRAAARELTELADEMGFYDE